MNREKQITDYMKNQEFDIDTIIDDFSSYVQKIINNMANQSLTYEDKEEILADTFFVLWKNRYNTILSLDSYIAGITRNLVREKLKKKTITYDISDYENILEFPISSLYPAEREEISKIEKSLFNLKTIDIKIVNMFYYSELSIKDISKKLNISEFNVKTRLYRIRKKIKKELNIGGYYGKK